MFPDNTLREEIADYQESVKNMTTELGLTTSLDFEESRVKVANGTPKLITDLDAIQEWIILFVITPRDTYEIYNGTDFGTSYRKLLGRKEVNNGYEEAELEREIREGLPMNPAIKSVDSVEITKNGRYLGLNIQVELYDGQLVETVIEKAYTVK